MTLSRPKPKREQDRAYRQWVATLPCIACAVEGRTTYGCDCAHVSYLGAKGFGSKVSDLLTVALCRPHHDEQHGENERLWWARLGVNPGRLTSALAAAYDAGDDGAAIVLRFAAEAVRAPRLVSARRLGEPTDTPASPPAVTLTAHLSAETDACGNRGVHVPTLGPRGLTTVLTFVAPEALEGA